MTRKVDCVYRSVHTADGHSIITTLPSPRFLFLVCRIAVAVLSIAILSCVPSYSQAGDTIPLFATLKNWKVRISLYLRRRTKRRSSKEKESTRLLGVKPLVGMIQ